jgi:Tfp pilus assembly protein PilN
VSQQINLFNPLFLEKKKRFAAVAMAQALLVLCAGTVALGFYVSARVDHMQQQAKAGAARLEQRQARLETVQEQFTPRKKNPEVAAQLAQAEAQLAALRHVSGVLARGELGDTSGYAGYFKALARQGMDGVWLTGVRIAGAGHDINIAGRALDGAAVPQYLGKLTREPLMQGKSFASLQIVPGAAAPGAEKEGGAAAAPYVEFTLRSTMDEVKR